MPRPGNGPSGQAHAWRGAACGPPGEVHRDPMSKRSLHGVAPSSRIGGSSLRLARACFRKQARGRNGAFERARIVSLLVADDPGKSTGLSVERIDELGRHRTEPVAPLCGAARFALGFLLVDAIGVATRTTCRSCEPLLCVTARIAAPFGVRRCRACASLMRASRSNLAFGTCLRDLGGRLALRSRRYRWRWRAMGGIAHGSQGLRWFVGHLRTPVQSMSVRACSARDAPIAVSTFLTSSGGGRTAGKPSASIHSSRHHPLVWYR